MIRVLLFFSLVFLCGYLSGCVSGYVTPADMAVATQQCQYHGGVSTVTSVQERTMEAYCTDGTHIKMEWTK